MLEKIISILDEKYDEYFEFTDEEATIVCCKMINCILSYCNSSVMRNAACQ